MFTEKELTLHWSSATIGSKDQLFHFGLDISATKGKVFVEIDDYKVDKEITIQLTPEEAFALSEELRKAALKIALERI